MEDEKKNYFIQANSPDGGFLASEAWRKFQGNTGKKTFHVEADGFWANVIEHKLSLVGKYFYVPRGPVMESGKLKFSNELIELAKKNDAGWLRIEPATEEILEIIKKDIKFPIKKAPHDVQPKEVFIIDISKSEEELLTGMKSKTRYNIRLAEKKGVEISSIGYGEQDFEKYFSEFLRLVKITAERDGIISHSGGYYRKMMETVPKENIKLYAAHYNGKIIAANIVVFFGNTSTYLHGASDNENRNLMAPYLLQWRQILDAKKAGCKQYDFGGVKKDDKGNDWAGITRFKTGFSPETKPVAYPGSYDIVISPGKYFLYLSLSKLSSILRRFKKS